MLNKQLQPILYFLSQISHVLSHALLCPLPSSLLSCTSSPAPWPSGSALQTAAGLGTQLWHCLQLQAGVGPALLPLPFSLGLVDGNVASALLAPYRPAQFLLMSAGPSVLWMLLRAVGSAELCPNADKMMFMLTRSGLCTQNFCCLSACSGAGGAAALVLAYPGDW